MADLTASGPLALALNGMARLLSNVAFFQTWTGTTNSTDASTHIIQGDIGAPVSAIVVASNVVSVFTREVHGLVPGQIVSLEGAAIGGQGDTDLSGVKTIVSIPTPTSFTFAQTTPDETLSSLADVMVIPARPMAMLMTDNKSLDVQQIGTGGVSNMSGAIDLLIEADVSTDYQNDSLNAMTEARNVAGELLQGISALADEDYLTVSRVELAQDPMFTARPEQTNSTIRFERWTALIRVYWGL